MTKPAPRFAYVYVMLREDGVRKVGCSTSTTRRRGQLRAVTGVKHTLERRWKMPVPAARITERFVHLELKPFRYNDGGSIEIYKLPLERIERSVNRARKAANRICPGGSLRELTDTEVSDIIEGRSDLKIWRTGVGVGVWTRRRNALPAKPLTAPKTWHIWGNRLLAEMYQRGLSMKRADPEDYRDEFLRGMTPSEALDQEPANG